MMNFRLRDLLELYDSGTWGEESKCEQSYPVLRSSDIKLNKLIYDNPAFIKIPEKDLSRKMLIDGDIIVTKSSGSPELIGKCGIFRTQKSGQNYFFSNFMLRVRPIAEKLESRWLYYYLISPMGKSVLKRMSNTTSGLRNLNINYYLDQWIPLPSLSEQKRIADLLDRADSLRQKRRESLALLDEFLKSVFIDMFGDPVRNEKGWEVKRLREIATICRNQVLPQQISTGVIYVDLESIEKQTGEFVNLKNSDNVTIKSSKFQFTRQHILYGKLRPYLNKVAMPDFDGICSTDILPILPVEGVSNKYFIAHLMRHDSFVNYANDRSSGANLPRVNAETVNDYVSIVPPYLLQNKFSDLVIKTRHSKEKMFQCQIEMDNQFNALLQWAFRGE